MAYLVSKYAKNDSLYPRDPKERAVVDQMMYFDAGTLYFNLIKCYVRIDLCSKIFKLILRPNPQYPPDILNEIDFSSSIHFHSVNSSFPHDSIMIKKIFSLSLGYSKLYQHNMILYWHNSLFSLILFVDMRYDRQNRRRLDAGMPRSSQFR